MTRFLFKVVSNSWAPLNGLFPCWSAGPRRKIGGNSLVDNNRIHLAWANRCWSSAADRCGCT